MQHVNVILLVCTQKQMILASISRQTILHSKCEFGIDLDSELGYFAIRKKKTISASISNFTLAILHAKLRSWRRSRVPLRQFCTSICDFRVDLASQFFRELVKDDDKQRDRSNGTDAAERFAPATVAGLFGSKCPAIEFFYGLIIFFDE